MTPEQTRDLLREAGAERAELADYAVRGTHVDALLPPTALRAAVEQLWEQEFLLEDVTAVDADPQLMAVYHFKFVGGGCRVTLRTLTDREHPEVPSIQDLYRGANWHERETHDFFGLVFTDHPDLSPLILPEDAGDLRPLRKAGKRLKPLGDVIPEFAAPPEPEAAATADDNSEGSA